MKAVFLDRDGVINELAYYPEAGVIDSPLTVEQFRLRPHVGKAIKLLNQMAYKVIVISNQPGIAKNHFNLNTLRKMDAKMKTELRAQGASVDGIYYCPHHPDGENSEYRVICPCRKPEPGLLLQAAKDYGLDLVRCYMVGDSLTDVQAGRKAGCKTILIGKMKCELCHLMDEEGARPDAIAGNLLEAVNTILRWEDKHEDIH